MERRQYLAATVGAVTLTAGCTSTGHTEMEGEIIDPERETSEVGLTPDPRPEDLEEVEWNREDFREYNAEGVLVEQVPVDVARYWYHTGRARFIDARVFDRYEMAHIKNAIHSPAPEGKPEDGIENFDKRERMVTYCTCPDHLSGLRAADLIEQGYSGVFALDEGLQPWVDNGYPTDTLNEQTTVPEQEDYSNVE